MNPACSARQRRHAGTLDSPSTSGRRLRRPNPRQAQRGGFTIGLVIGLLVGLALALGVALYVTKAPNPFVNKVPQRSAVQDAAEAERNRNWDPNAALGGKNPARPSTGTTAAPPRSTAPEVQPAPPGVVPPIAVAPRSTKTPSGDAATVLGPSPGTGVPPNAASAALSGARPAAPLAALRSAAPPLSAAAGSDPFSYFVQAGAYARTEDAEQQRARLAMLGIESRLTERDQGGRTVYRVRLGPFDRKGDADSAKEKLSDAGIDAALVRVQK